MEELLPIFPVFVIVHRRLESIEPSMQIAYPKSSTIILTPGVVYNRKKKKKKKKQERKYEIKSYRYLRFRTELPPSVIS